MKKIFFLCALCSFDLCVSGCASFNSFEFSSVKTNKPISMTNEINRPYIVVRHFVVEQKTPLLFLARMVTAGNPNLDDLLQNELTGGDAIVNVRIKGYLHIGDMLLPIAIGIGGVFVEPILLFVSFMPFFLDLKSYSVEGDLVRYTSSISTKDSDQHKSDVIDIPLRFNPETGVPIP